MDGDSGQPPLARRVPGANLRQRALPSPSPPVLSDAVVRRVQAAVEAERASPGQPALSAAQRPSSPADGREDGGTRRRP
jgi:hypothetical protein